jgi:thiol:disulfide interchange protein
MVQFIQNHPKKSRTPFWRICVPITLFVLLLLVVTPLGPDKPSIQGSRVLWETDFPGAYAKAIREHRGMLLFFSVDWCPHCQEMKATTFSDPRVDKASSNRVRVYVDGEKHRELAHRFGVHSYPVLVLLDSTGTDVGRFKGSADANRFLTWISRTR